MTRFTVALLGCAGLLLDLQRSPMFRSTVDVVPVYATVTLPGGGFATGLTRDDFTLTDNGARQPVVSFSADVQPLSVSIVLDTSASMSTAMSRVTAAAGTLLRDLMPADRATVSTLGFPSPAYTADMEWLRARLYTLEWVRDGRSQIWEALEREMARLATERARRIIVIHTDGRNRGLRLEDQVRRQAKRDDVTVYVIGFEGASLPGNMKAFARESGGRAVTVKLTDDLGLVFASIADELHHQYLLGFTPAAFDDKGHKIDVHVTTPGAIVRARQSYLAAAR